MIRITILYPAHEGASFDHDYYRDTHVPLAFDVFREYGCRRIEIDRGIEGPEPGQKPAFVAVCHVIVDSLEGFQKALAEHGPKILGDIPNFTDIRPQLQVNEMVDPA